MRLLSFIWTGVKGLLVVCCGLALFILGIWVAMRGVYWFLGELAILLILLFGLLGES